MIELITKTYNNGRRLSFNYYVKAYGYEIAYYAPHKTFRSFKAALKEVRRKNAEHEDDPRLSAFRSEFARSADLPNGMRVIAINEGDISYLESYGRPTKTMRPILNNRLTSLLRYIDSLNLKPKYYAGTVESGRQRECVQLIDDGDKWEGR